MMFLQSRSVPTVYGLSREAQTAQPALPKSHPADNDILSNKEIGLKMLPSARIALGLQQPQTIITSILGTPLPDSKNSLCNRTDSHNMLRSARMGNGSPAPDSIKRSAFGMRPRVHK